MSDDFKVNINEYLPLREIVFTTIRDAIISGKLMPGERLMEKHLAEKIGVSRTPVREALRKLEIEGFVLMTPRKGAIVTVINEKDIKDVLEIRAVLEGLAAALACENMMDAEIDKLMSTKKDFENAVEAKNLDLMVEKDIELHDLIFASTKNNRLVTIINNLREQIHRFRIAYLKDANYLKTIIIEHDKIVQAIVNKDKDVAQELSVNHIKNQEKAVIKSIKTT